MQCGTPAACALSGKRQPRHLLFSITALPAPVQVVDVSPDCGPKTDESKGAAQKELSMLLTSPSGKGPLFTLVRQICTHHCACHALSA